MKPEHKVPITFKASPEVERRLRKSANKNKTTRSSRAEALVIAGLELEGVKK